MPTSAEIDALKALLKKAQLRAEKAEKKIKQLEKQVERKQAASDELQNKLKDREQQIEEYECLIPKLMEFLILCKEHVIQLRNELPEIQQDFWDKLMENFSENWENLPEYRRLARFVLKGSEKTGRPLLSKLDLCIAQKRSKTPDFRLSNDTIRKQAPCCS